MGRHDVDARGDHGLAQRHHLVPRHAALQHVHGGDAEDDDEIGADRGARPPDDLDREAHAVLERAAPAVGPPVGLLDQEGRDQVAGRADDLDAVVARLPGHRCAVGEVGDLLLDAGLVEFLRHEGADARLDGRRRDAVPRARQRPGVQDLQADLHVGIGGMHRLGDQPVLRRLLRPSRRLRTPSVCGSVHR